MKNRPLTSGCHQLDQAERDAQKTTMREEIISW